jgi:hypothetical protein
VGERHSHAAEINTCPDPYNKFDPIMSWVNSLINVKVEAHIYSLYMLIIVVPSLKYSSFIFLPCCIYLCLTFTLMGLLAECLMRLQQWILMIHSWIWTIFEPVSQSMRFVCRLMIQRNWYLPSGKRHIVCVELLYFILSPQQVAWTQHGHSSFGSLSYRHIFNFFTFTCICLLVFLHWSVFTYLNTGF